MNLSPLSKQLRLPPIFRLLVLLLGWAERGVMMFSSVFLWFLLWMEMSMKCWITSWSLSLWYYWVSKLKMIMSFILDCYEMLHKFGIVLQHEVEFLSFQLQGEAKSGGELIWSACLIPHLHLLVLNFMLCF